MASRNVQRVIHNAVRDGNTIDAERILPVLEKHNIRQCKDLFSVVLHYL